MINQLFYQEILYINLEDVDEKIFSGGEIQVNIARATGNLKNLYDSSHVKIKANLRNSHDIMKLMLTVNAIASERNGIKITLFIPYLPYARQDRICNRGEANSLQVMLNLLETMCLKEDVNINIEVVDIHNIETLMRKKFIKNISAYPVIKKIVNYNPENDVIILPDNGARQRYASEIDENDVVFNLSKSRNGNNVETSFSFDHIATDNLTGKRLIVIDDICDGGATFIAVAKSLSNIDYKSLELCVAHGIFRNGMDDLYKYYNKINFINNLRKES